MICRCSDVSNKSAALAEHFGVRLLFHRIKTCKPLGGFSPVPGVGGIFDICRSNVPFLLLNFVSINRIEDFESFDSIDVSEHKLSELNDRSGERALKI